jgi:hypothetical protein
VWEERCQKGQIERRLEGNEIYLLWANSARRAIQTRHTNTAKLQRSLFGCWPRRSPNSKGSIKRKLPRRQRRTKRTVNRRPIDTRSREADHTFFLRPALPALAVSAAVDQARIIVSTA